MHWNAARKLQNRKARLNIRVKGKGHFIDAQFTRSDENAWIPRSYAFGTCNSILAQEMQACQRKLHAFTHAPRTRATQYTCNSVHLLFSTSKAHELSTSSLYKVKVWKESNHKITERLATDFVNVFAIVKATMLINALIFTSAVNFLFCFFCFYFNLQPPSGLTETKFWSLRTPQNSQLFSVVLWPFASQTLCMDHLQ